MANNNAIAFLQKVAGDPALQKQLGVSTDGMNIGQFISNAHNAGYNFTEQEIMDVIQNQPLDDAELDQVTGGSNNRSIILTGGLTFKSNFTIYMNNYSKGR